MLDKELLNYIGNKKKYIVFIVIFNILNLLSGVGITALSVLSIKHFIEYDFYGGFLFIGLTLISTLTKILFTKISADLSSTLADYVVFKLRDDTYRKFLKVHGKTPFSVQEMAQLSTEGIEQLRLYFANYIPTFFYALIAPLILFIIFMFIDVPVAIIYLVCVPLIPMSIIMVSKWAKKIFNKYWDQYISLGDAFLDNTMGMKELKIFMYDEIKEKKMMEESESFRKITMKVLTMQLASITIMDLVAFGGAGVGIVFSLIAMRNGLDVYLTLFMILVGAEFFLPMRALGSAFHVAMNGATAGKKVIKLLQEEDYFEGKKKINSIEIIDIKNITFKYLENNVLENLSLKLEKGFNSVVGLSGSGKSTLAKLCSKIVKVNTGEILVNSINIDDINSNYFYKKMCYISNNTFVFHNTIRELFRFYKNDILDEDIKELLYEVRLEHLSLDLKINDLNSNISGGEKQRLVLALYLSNDYDFYIFDEATSNIDIESEEIILKKIHSLSKNKIILFITHRLKNVINSSQIYYLESGKIVESGNFKDLMNNNSNFKKLYDFQNNLEDY